MTEITSPADFVSLSTSEECLGQCRWVPAPDSKRLQQLWAVTSYKDGKPWGAYHEWRDVPIEVVD